MDTEEEEEQPLPSYIEVEEPQTKLKFLKFYVYNGAHNSLVTKAQKEDSKEIIVCKSYPIIGSKEYDEESRAFIDSEVTLLEKLSGAQVPECKGHGDGITSLDENTVFVSTRYLGDGDLFDLGVSQRFSMEVIRYITKEIVKGLLLIHKKGVVHLDIKPENVILTDKGEVMIIDFGHSFNTKSGIVVPEVGTATYSPLECIKPKGLYVNGYLVDIYLTGVTLFMLVFHFGPRDLFLYSRHFENEDFPTFWEQLNNVYKERKMKNPVEKDPQLKDLFQGLLHPLPEKRLDPEKVLKHPWFSGKTASIEQVKAEIMENRKKFLETDS